MVVVSPCPPQRSDAARMRSSLALGPRACARERMSVGVTHADFGCIDRFQAIPKGFHHIDRLFFFLLHHFWTEEVVSV